MANFPQKRNVNVAVASKRRHDLSHAHITTTDFGRFKPIEMRYMVPGDEFNYNINSVTRVLNPMPSPTFGQFDLKYRMFFVPIHNIWTPFYDYLKNQATSVNGVLTQTTSPVYAYFSDLIEIFNNEANGLTEQVTGSVPEGSYDYNYMASPSTSNFIYRKFTKHGRIIYDWLTAMRLNIPFGMYNQGLQGSSQNSFNVLPLIAFWKFYFDWIVPSRFVHDHQNYIQLLISYISSRASYRLTQSDLLKYILVEPLSYFLDDLFTTSTPYPFQGADLSNPIELGNPSYNFNGVGVDTYSQENINGAYAYPESDNNTFNMWTLQTLGKLQDYLNRGLIAGTKVQDWLLSEFGLRPSTDALHLSEYKGMRSNTLKIQDIVSSADTLSSDGTTGVPLGAYGGFVKDRFDFDFSYKANEHGYIFITYELVPRTSYYQGLEPEYTMMNRFDFFQPEFDNQQGSPISYGDLISDVKNGFIKNANFKLNNIFGFNLQYSRLKFANDVISGDFRNRFGGELKSWFLARDMNYLITRTDQGLIDEDFCLVNSHYQNWHYIFSDMSDELDPFLSIFYFNQPCLRPMKSISEGFEPEYKNSNKSVSLDFQGSVE